ncbi:MAG TPA: hypothetical protein VLH19_02965 [Patescibacteria group bacterium]|nr:hypothetical protein [Patescibacteria group bacterium]
MSILRQADVNQGVPSELSAGEKQKRLRFWGLTGNERVGALLREDVGAQERLKKEKELFLEVGTDVYPAYSVKISFEDFQDDDTYHRAQDLYNSFFQEHPKLGLLYATRGGKNGSLVGVVTPSEQFSLEEILKQLSLVKRNVATGHVLVGVCEQPEKQLLVMRLNKKQISIDAAGSTGLTYLSWAESKWRSSKTASSTISLVTPQDLVDADQEAGQVGLVRKNARFVEKLESKNDPEVYEAPPNKAPGKKYSVRTVEFTDDEISTAIKTELPKSERDVHLIDEQKELDFYKSAATSASMAFLDAHKPGWEESLGSVEIQLENSLHVVVKIDVSGLSKLVALGLGDPGIHISRMLKNFLAPGDQIFKDDEFLVTTAGDALVLFFPTSIEEQGTIMQKLVKLFFESSQVFLRNAEEEIHEEMLKGLGLHNLDIKTYISLDKNPPKVRLMQGGLVSFETEGTVNEDKLEKLAKTGGYNLSVEFTEPLDEQKAREIFAGRPYVMTVLEAGSKKTYVYRVAAAPTVLEQQIRNLVANEQDFMHRMAFRDVGDEDSKMKFALFTKLKEMQAKHTEIFAGEGNTPNTNIAAAKILYALLEYVKGVHGGQLPDHSSTVAECRGALANFYDEIDLQWFTICLTSVLIAEFGVFPEPGIEVNLQPEINRLVHLLNTSASSGILSVFPEVSGPGLEPNLKLSE